MNKQFYLILSHGEYSDYSPEYFVGETEVTQEDFDKKAVEIGDKLFAEWNSFPERPHVCMEGCWHFSAVPGVEKYDPKTNEGVSSSPFDWGYDKWFSSMREWIAEKGFKELPENIPEINISYSDYPTSHKK